VRGNAKEKSNERQKLARLVGNAWDVRTRLRAARARVCVCMFVSVYVFICVHVASGKYCTLRKSKRRATDPNYASASRGEITLNAL